MLPYILIALCIVFLMIIAKGRRKKSLIIIAYLLLTVFAGIRGDFTSDYSGYCELFIQANSFNSIGDILYTPFYTEKGFMLLMFIFGRILNSPIAFIFFMSAITNYAVFFVIYKKSDNPWLSILLYLCVGTYYDSFNISRFILVTVIMFACHELIIKRKFWTFIVVVLLSMNIHRMAVVMIPMYFLLNIKVSQKGIFKQFALGSLFILLLPFLKQIVQSLFPIYNGYSFGMAGGTWKTIVIPAAMGILLIYALVLNRRSTTFDINQPINRLMLNAYIYQIIFTLGSMQIYMVTRLIFFVSPYLWLFIPNVISNIRNSQDRRFLFLLVVVLAIAYQYVVYSGTGYEPYYTIYGA